MDESDNIGFHDGTRTGRTSTHDGKFGTVSQPNLKVCRNKEYAWTLIVNPIFIYSGVNIYIVGAVSAV